MSVKIPVAREAIEMAFDRLSTDDVADFFQQMKALLVDDETYNTLAEIARDVGKMVP